MDVPDTQVIATIGVMGAATWSVTRQVITSYIALMEKQSDKFAARLEEQTKAMQAIAAEMKEHNLVAMEYQKRSTESLAQISHNMGSVGLALDSLNQAMLNGHKAASAAERQSSHEKPTG